MWLEDKVGLWLNRKVFSKEQEASFESASGYIVGDWTGLGYFRHSGNRKQGLLRNCRMVRG